MLFKICKWIYLALLFFWLLAPTPSVTAREGLVFVSEVYYQPSTYSARDKWVELYNPTDQTVSLEGYALIIGKKGYRFELTRNIAEASIAPYATYLIEDSWGDKAHLLREHGHVVEDTSGVLHWLSNVTTEPHLTLSLEYRGEIVQDIRYDSARVSQWSETHPWTSLECARTECVPARTRYDDTYRISPGQYAFTQTAEEPPVQTESERVSEPQVSPVVPVEPSQAQSVFPETNPVPVASRAVPASVAITEPQEVPVSRESAGNAVPVSVPLAEASKLAVPGFNPSVSAEILPSTVHEQSDSVVMSDPALLELTSRTSLDTTALTSSQTLIGLPRVNFVGTQTDAPIVNFRELSVWILLALSGYLLERTLLRPRHDSGRTHQSPLLTIPATACTLEPYV